MEHILCYVHEPFAYFVNASIDEIWGDDWNDAPYEHNAGEPYERDGQYCIKVAFDGPFQTPASMANGNSQYSVQAINAGAVAWLTNSQYRPSDKPLVNIRAGVTIDEFVRLIQAGGGAAYLTAPTMPVKVI